jgi:hypothetical protein
LCTLLLGCGAAGEEGAPALRHWDACTFLDDAEVASAIGAVDAGQLTKTTNPVDFDWSTDATEWTRKIAISRCSYSAKVNGVTRNIDLVARLSGSADRSESQTRRLLQAQGYSPKSVSDLKCADGGLWISEEPEAPAGELHAFVELPDRKARTGCGETNLLLAAPLSAHAVLFLDGWNDSKAELQTARALMDKALPKLRDAMSEIGRGNYSTTPDAGEAGAEFIDAGSQIAASDFPVVAAQHQCSRLAACCSYDERAASQVPVADLSQCAALLGLAYGAVLSTALESVASGRLAYDEAQARQCLERFDDQACDGLKAQTVRIPCAEVFAGKAAEGEGCISDFECASAYCAQDHLVRLLLDGGVELVDAGSQGASELDASLESASLEDASFAMDQTDGGSDAGQLTPNQSTGHCAPRGVDGESCTQDDECASGSCQASLCVDPVPVPWCTGL